MQSAPRSKNVVYVLCLSQRPGSRISRLLLCQGGPGSRISGRSVSQGGSGSRISRLLDPPPNGPCRSRICRLLLRSTVSQERVSLHYGSTLSGRYIPENDELGGRLARPPPDLTLRVYYNPRKHQGEVTTVTI